MVLNFSRLKVHLIFNHQVAKICMADQAKAWCNELQVLVLLVSLLKDSRVTEIQSNTNSSLLVEMQRSSSKPATCLTEEMTAMEEMTLTEDRIRMEVRCPMLTTRIRLQPDLVEQTPLCQRDRTWQGKDQVTL